MAPVILVDSGFLYALYDSDDENHLLARTFADEDRRIRIVPDVVLTEVAHILKRSIGLRAVARFLEDVVQPPIQLQPIQPEDVLKARTIMLDYADSRLDFVDCCIMALAERMNITQVCTFDYRDFHIFRPKHCPVLELLP